MDFDHVDPKEKSFQVTDGCAMLMDRERLLDEVAKCDIVCATCHRIRSCKQWPSGGLGPEHWGERTRPTTPRAERARAKYRRWRARHLDLLRPLRERPCADCGGRFPWFVMEFDHRDRTAKVRGVMALAGHVSDDRLMAEVAKCDVVCPTCHRDRTFQRRQSSFRPARKTPGYDYDQVLLADVDPPMPYLEDMRPKVE